MDRGVSSLTTGLNCRRRSIPTIPKTCIQAGGDFVFVHANASSLHQVSAGQPFDGRQNDMQCHQYENIAVNGRHMSKPKGRNTCGQTDRITQSVVAVLEQRIQSQSKTPSDYDIEIVFAKPTKKLIGPIASIPETTPMNETWTGRQESYLYRNERMDNGVTVVENELYERSDFMT